MNYLLITNNDRLISKYEGKIDIENSIMLGIEKKEKYEFIIVDEDNFKFESIETLNKLKKKIVILGYNPIKKHLFINKEVFNIDEIDHLLSNENIEGDVLNVDVNEDEDEEKIKSKDKKILELYEKLTNEGKDFEQGVEEFIELEYEEKRTIFLMLPPATLKKVKRNKEIKQDYKKFSNESKGENEQKTNNCSKIFADIKVILNKLNFTKHKQNGSD